MEPHQINWLKNWKHFNWTGLDSKQLLVTKKAFKSMAKIVIESHLDKIYQRALKRFEKSKKLHKKSKRPIKYKIRDLSWEQETLTPFAFFLVVHLTPPPTVKKKGQGGTKSVISPTDPPTP